MSPSIFYMYHMCPPTLHLTCASLPPLPHFILCITCAPHTSFYVSHVPPFPLPHTSFYVTCAPTLHITCASLPPPPHFILCITCASHTSYHMWLPSPHFRCGNVAAILELDENLKRDFTKFEAAPNVSIIIIC